MNAFRWSCVAIALTGLPGCAPTLRAPVGPLPPTLTNALGMEFVLIAPGSMVVGRFQPACPTAGRSGTPTFVPPGGQRPAGAAAPQPGPPRPPPEPGALWSAADAATCAELARRDATPGFHVTIERPFYLGRYEVTQAQWKGVMGSNPSLFQGSRVTDDADRHPVDNVSWSDAQAFIRRLNQIDRTARYRLPTEFEWEYAARAGAPGELLWSAAREQAATGRTTQPVGTRTPNAWGLYDVVGNVWEWVEDFYNEKTFPDPAPPRSGREHVLKGASFLGDVKNLTWATHAAGPGNGFDVGFRVVREPRRPRGVPLLLRSAEDASTNAARGPSASRILRRSAPFGSARRAGFRRGHRHLPRGLRPRQHRAAGTRRARPVRRRSSPLAR